MTSNSMVLSELHSGGSAKQGFFLTSIAAVAYMLQSVFSASGNYAPCLHYLVAGPAVCDISEESFISEKRCFSSDVTDVRTIFFPSDKISTVEVGLSV